MEGIESFVIVDEHGEFVDGDNYDEVFLRLLTKIKENNAAIFHLLNDELSHVVVEVEGAPYVVLIVKVEGGTVFSKVKKGANVDDLVVKLKSLLKD
jgi:uncharacterized protein (UPF0262 family)